MIKLVIVLDHDFLVESSTLCTSEGEQQKVFEKECNDRGIEITELDFHRGYVQLEDNTIIHALEVDEYCEHCFTEEDEDVSYFVIKVKKDGLVDTIKHCKNKPHQDMVFSRMREIEDANFNIKLINNAKIELHDGDRIFMIRSYKLED